MMEAIEEEQIKISVLWQLLLHAVAVISLRLSYCLLLSIGCVVWNNHLLHRIILLLLLLLIIISIVVVVVDSYKIV